MKKKNIIYLTILCIILLISDVGRNIKEKNIIYLKSKTYIKKIKSFFSAIHITATDLYVLIKMFFWGIIFAEIGWFLLTFAKTLVSHFPNKNCGRTVIVIYAVFLLFIFYLFTQKFLVRIKKTFLKSKRIDLLIALIVGMLANILWGSFLVMRYEKIITSLSPWRLLAITCSPLIIGVSFIAFISRLKDKEDKKSFFIPDIEVGNIEDDLLNFSEKANNFAKKVYDNGSLQSLVFGLDAPWGIGKSSFINLCEEYWNKDKKYKNKVLVYKFSPLRYMGDANLLDAFINGLIQAIQKDSFVPEIRPLISRYSRLLKEVGRFSVFGIHIPTFNVGYSIDDALDDLKIALSRFNKKIIIVVDDLDRIEFPEIKNILFAIRKSFVLSNISYVLCYDTRNIGLWDMETPNTEKVEEFLEKFVNIKISLFLNGEDLSKYVSKNLNMAVSDKPVNPLFVKQAVGGLLDIYKSPKYHHYLPFIGDVRRLKRLINTVVLLGLHLIKYDDTDFDKHDLIHLLLIYIYYPNIFRKIYDTETNGGRGFFSVIVPYEDDDYEIGRKYPGDEQQEGGSSNNSHYRNSKQYEDYITKLPESSKFLLEQVFNLSHRFKNTKIDDIPDEVRTSLACFNGGWTNGRNLEEYLNLIVNFSQPTKTGQHIFYIKRKNLIFNGSKTIDQVFADDFAYNKGEQIREKLWRVIINNAQTLSHDIGASVITYLLDNAPVYSLIEVEGSKNIGLRHNLDHYITRLLNDAGWIDKSHGHSRNTPENIKEIAEWIFGEKRHVGNGVLKKLSQPERGVLGLYDLLTFRLYCSADRGGDIFNLTRALSLHAREDAPTSGDTRTIAREEMREISQKVFAIFKEQYIDSNKNLFTEIANLRFEDLAGRYSGFIRTQISKGKFSQRDIDEKIEILKRRITSFIVYQIGSDFIDLGVGCGFYDLTGNKDEQEIKHIFNKYLFDFCFNPDNKKKDNEKENYEYFLDYLFGNFTRIFAAERDDRQNYVPHIGEFTKALDKSELAKYWHNHAKTIKGLNLTKKDKKMRIGNYTATYKHDLKKLFKVLDDFVVKEQKDKIEKIKQIIQIIRKKSKTIKDEAKLTKKETEEYKNLSSD